jgi:RNA polymerase sigma factor (sigma-70 family)
MACGSPGTKLRYRLDTLFKFGVVNDQSDRQLLEQFLTAKDGADQAAFSALVERHGPMVLSLCSKVLGNPHDAEDAFQAAFLVLARRAGSVRKAESLASWLHGVAVRVAVRAKTAAARRTVCERRGAMMRVVGSVREGSELEAWAEVHEEIARLPARYRQPVVLCYLEGLTTEEAALRLGCPRGTIMSRLSRARQRLRSRLERRDLAMPAALLAAGQTSRATLNVSAILLDTTVRASLGFAERGVAEAALASAKVTALARGVLGAMTISKLKILGAVALACALTHGGVQGLGQLSSRGGRQEPAGAVPDARDPKAALARSMDKLEGGLADAGRRNAEMRKELRGVQAKLEATGVRSEATDVNGRVFPLARLGNGHTSRAVDRFAEVLKRYPRRRGSMEGGGCQVYMMDLVDGGITLIADEPGAGRSYCGAPRWSHDGSRIVFDATPGTDWVRSRLMSVEVRDGRPTFTDLGPGDSPTFSPDDKTIAFALNSGAIAGAEPGVWLMQADGSGRRRVSDYGAPFWSRERGEILINSFSNPTESIVLNLEKMTEVRLAVDGYQILWWPRWVGPGTLVAGLATKNAGHSIALLDVSSAAEAKIIEVLWKRGEVLDVTPLNPLYCPDTGCCFFVGVKQGKRTIYCVKRGEAPRVTALGPEAKTETLGSLDFSPDGRYLLFGANWPAQVR